MFTKYSFGKGEVFFLNFGMEMVLAKYVGSFEEKSPDYARLYEVFAKNILSKRLLRKDMKSKMLALTEYSTDAGKNVCVGVNHSSKKMVSTLEIIGMADNCRVLAGNACHKKKVLNVSLDPGEGFIVDL